MSRCCYLIVVAAACIGANPASAAAVAGAPGQPDPSSRFQQGQLLLRSGELDDALRVFDALRREHPADVDYAFARAQALHRLGRIDDALDELDEAARLAPDYEDVYRMRYLLVASGEHSKPKSTVTAILEQTVRRYPDARWLLAAPEPEWTLVLSGNYENLDNGFADWNNQFVEIARSRANRSFNALRLGRDQRGSAVDQWLGAGGQWRFADRWNAGVDVAFSSNPQIIAELGFTAHVGATLAQGWGVDLAYRRREYTADAVSSGLITVEKYFADFRIAYQLGLSRLDGASNFANHSATFNWYVNEASSVGLSVNSGREAESIGNGRVLETDVRGLSIVGSHKLNPRLGLRTWLGIHNQGDLYRRLYIGMAVSIGI